MAFERFASSANAFALAFCLSFGGGTAHTDALTIEVAPCENAVDSSTLAFSVKSRGAVHDMGGTERRCSDWVPSGSSMSSEEPLLEDIVSQKNESGSEEGDVSSTMMRGTDTLVGAVSAVVFSDRDDFEADDGGADWRSRWLLRVRALR